MSSYRIGEKIGTGGMADVYLALQEGLGGFEKLVVFKRMLHWVADREEYVSLFFREARMAAVMSHPNVVATLDIGQDDSGPFMVMEYLNGETLSFMMRTLNQRQQAVPVNVACKIGADVAAGLHYAHHLSLPNGRNTAVIHRDVTPSNIMCCYSGAVKLLDFGIAKVSSEELTREGILKGKMGHIAPEQLRGGEVAPVSDVFQLGIVLWEMLTMRHLFSGKTDAERMYSVLDREVPPPSRFTPAVPAKLDQLVLSALERDPQARCPSALALEEGLRDILRDIGPSEGGSLGVGAWMQATFPERLAWRQDLERRTRDAEPLLTYVTVPSIPSPSGVRASYDPVEPSHRLQALAVVLFGSALTVAGVVMLALLVILIRMLTVPAPAPVEAQREVPAVPAPVPAQVPSGTRDADPEPPAPASPPTVPGARPAGTPAARPAPSVPPARSGAATPAPAPSEPTAPAPAASPVGEITDNEDPWADP
ncbi:MAG: serine/threonine-protein kinase [Myxococcota bacterium]